MNYAPQTFGLNRFLIFKPREDMWQSTMSCVTYLLVFLLFEFNFVELLASSNKSMQISEQESSSHIFDLSQIKSRKLLEISTETTSTDITEEDLSFGEKVAKFYADDNNMALYCVLPLLILVYGGCSVIYCVHKCRRHFRKKNRTGGSKLLLMGDNVSDGDVNVRAPNKRRPLSARSNRIAPVPIPKPEIVHPKIKMTPNEQVKDLLTDYEFFTSWVIAQKTADLVKFNGGKHLDSPILSESSNISRNYGSAVGGKKKKLVFLT